MIFESFVFALVLLAILCSALVGTIRFGRKKDIISMMAGILIHIVLVLEGTVVYYLLYHEFEMYQYTGSGFERAILVSIPLLSVIYNISALLIERNKRITTITSNSVTEAFSKIDCGLCYAEMNGNPVMTNKLMQELSVKIQGANISDASSFWEKIVGFTKNDTVSRILFTSEPTFIFPDNRVFSFSRNVIEAEGKKRYEIVARDVTVLFKQSEELAENNRALEAVEFRLSETFANIAALKQEEELISYKFHIHDELGNAVLSGVNAMRRGKISEEDKEILIGKWEKTLNDLSNNLIAGNMSGENSYIDLHNTAKMLGVSLEINGDFPRLNEIAAMAVREAMYNAVKHSGADCITVNATKKEEGRVIVISDNGVNKDKVTSEGGGLSNLRKKIEKIGGTLKIDWEGSVVLTIILPERPEI